jgi:ubiquitin-conjugating enzyme E2 variant
MSHSHVQAGAPTLPSHYELSRARWIFAAASIAAAFLLLGALGVRIGARVGLAQWWVPLAFAAGMAAADFGSALVHWGADTWGRDDLPVIGHRLLFPFRVHHVHPEDFLRRRFVQTNGDVALLAALVLLGLLALPLGTGWGGLLAVGGFAFCGVGMLTNQIHQWAHMPSPPRPVRVLQALGLVLGRSGHALHHERPYDTRYAITTGWCNRPLEAIGFFRRLEAAITRLTGVLPRHDDRRYEARYGVPSSRAGSRAGAPHG